ncbi:MAG: glycosyltransferase family 4 protein [Bacteroidetes bacterium]|nr:glycosyltransferase family 4 protein [Bacteroidota bacterium]
MSKTKSILILYYELAGYTIACFEALSKKHDVNIHVVRYPTNAVAPFEIAETNNTIKYYNYTETNEKELENIFNLISPNLILCCGWGNKRYLNFCKKRSKKTPIAIAFDNQWLGTLKQYIGIFYFKLFLKKHFKYAFVPGKRQANFAEKIGFEKKFILSGFYSADVELFYSYKKNTTNKKSFVFIGRYEPEKGIQLLCETFLNLFNAGFLQNWQLICAGKGTYEIPKHEAIINYGFIQPKNLGTIIEQGTVLVLPSVFEPWGVVVHEFAAASFPLICSTNVGAADAFLINEKNGFLIIPNNYESLKNVLIKMSNFDSNQLNQMGNISKKLASVITPTTWAETIYNLL